MDDNTAMVLITLIFTAPLIIVLAIGFWRD